MLVHYWEVRVISIFESRVKTRVTRARQLQNALWRHTHTKDIQWTFESQSIHATPKRADDATSHQNNCRILSRNSGASSADLAAKVDVPFPLQIGTQQRAKLDLNHFWIEVSRRKARSTVDQCEKKHPWRPRNAWDLSSRWIARTPGLDDALVAAKCHYSSAYKYLKSSYRHQQLPIKTMKARVTVWASGSGISSWAIEAGTSFKNRQDLGPNLGWPRTWNGFH